MSQKKATTGTRDGATKRAPAPKDKLSPEWRAWKLRWYRRAFLQLGGEEYDRAWAEYRELLTGLFFNEDFWHVSYALALLPHLLTARQRIDLLYLEEKRSRAAMKGAKTRRRNAQAASKAE